MEHKLDRYVEGYSEQMVRDTLKLVGIKSEKGEPAPGAPMGAEIGRCMEEALHICSSLGFRTKNCDGYCGWAEIGQGEEMVAVLAHMDIVPVGNGWSKNPMGQVENGRIYGRGAIDDKGPAVAAIYAAKALLDSGEELSRRVRLIFGTDEENQWRCMDYYSAHEEAPAMGFSPDAEFPVIFAEKGVMFLEVSGRYAPEKDSVRIISLTGGERPNMVPDLCRAEIYVPESKAEQVRNWLGEGMSLSGGRLNIETHGRTAHGSTPEKGENAIAAMMERIVSLPGLDDGQRAFAEFYNSHAGRDTTGEKYMGCLISDAPSGKLVLNPGMLRMDESGFCLTINIRYPVTVRGEQVASLMTSAGEKAGYTTKITKDSAPLYQSESSPTVQTLLSVYRDYVPEDRDARPLCIGGGTYARAIKNAASFGPVFPGQPELAHCPDEFIAIEDLVKNSKMYAEAMLRLAK